MAKVGRDAASHCARIHVHDHRHDLVWLGDTQLGTPVLVDRLVAASDFVIGVGGVYPQHTTWFGGGSKILLGVLGERSIAHLHYRHWKLGERYSIDNEFRADLNQVAEIVGLRASISIHVDAARRPVRVVSGDHLAYYESAAMFTRDAFRAPAPTDADVVISNAYPMDTSVTFAQSKGTTPLKHARPSASRVLIAACPEGAGHHGLFPLFRVPRHYYKIQKARRAWINRSELPNKITDRLRAMRQPAARSEVGASGPRMMHVYRPIEAGERSPIQLPGAREVSHWEDVLRDVAGEQGAGRRLRAVVYPCAPLQVLEF
jgi:nickel-dependent lactate racemase